MFEHHVPLSALLAFRVLKINPSFVCYLVWQIITLQDPSNPEHMSLRDISNFKHLQVSVSSSLAIIVPYIQLHFHSVRMYGSSCMYSE